jgi:hypothetical protein
LAVRRGHLLGAHRMRSSPSASIGEVDAPDAGRLVEDVPDPIDGGIESPDDAAPDGGVEGRGP